LSCSTKTQKNDYQVPGNILISGEILNFETGLPVSIQLNTTAFDSKRISVPLDSTGKFAISFESYTSTDVLLEHGKHNFTILVHPSDSIYVEFDNGVERHIDFFGTVKFDGNAAKTNQDALVFQMMYYARDWDDSYSTASAYNTDAFLQYLFNMQQAQIQLYKQFMEQTSASEDAKNWALTKLQGYYYADLAFYPDRHRKANNLPVNEWDVPSSYYNPFSNFTITEQMFISGNALNNFIINAIRQYNEMKIWNEPANVQYIKPDGSISAPEKLIDSVTIYGLINYINDDLSRQIVLTNYLYKRKTTPDLKFFEKFKGLIEKYIQKPYLKNPLFDFYKQNK
jgi:hypothetical protein